MRQLSARMLIKGALLAILVSMIFNLSAIPFGFAAPTQVVVVAPAGNISVPTQFSVDINVVEVSDLYGWQIKLYFDPAVLLWLNGTLPPGHVFDGKPFAAIPAFKGSDAGGTYILFTNILLGDTATFYGSGILCRISFEAQAAGTSTLVFSRPLGGWGSETWLLSNYDRLTNPDNPTIVFDAVDGSVNVVGADTRLPTSLSCNLDKSVLVIGDVGDAWVAISGAINVTVPDGTQVNIESWNYSDPFETEWSFIVAVSTTSNQYSYTWYPTEAGPIGIRSRWAGDSSYKPAASEVSNMSISFSTTYVGVQPKAQQTLGDRNSPLPTSAFAFNVTVTNVTDLREWKIKLDFNQTILAATEASLPTYNVFGADYTLIEATINNTAGFVQVGARSSAASFNGSGVGVLCQVKFQGIGAPVLQTSYRYGSSDLTFDSGATSLKDTPGTMIVFNWEQEPAGSARVEAIRRQQTQISLEISSSITMGNNVNVTGMITPAGAGLRVDVTITYRTATMTERVLAIVKTDSSGRYVYTWNANATGTYAFTASWAGDVSWEGDSAVKTVIVVEQNTSGGPDLTTYLIIAGVAAVVVVAVVVLYLVKFRKRPETPAS